MTEREFRSIYRTLVVENPIALHAVLKVLDLQFTRAVPTLAVTCSDRPLLLVNLDFVRQHCQTDREVAAVIVHELLHVVMLHTRASRPITAAENIAFDAVINAIIHRSMGSDASSMMQRYYAQDRGWTRLLRPPLPNELQAMQPTPADTVWSRLYNGTVTSADVLELLHRFHPQLLRPLLGNHDADLKRAGSDAARRLLAEAIDVNLPAVAPSLNPKCGGRKYGDRATQRAFEMHAKRLKIQRWQRETHAILMRHLTAGGSATMSAQSAVTLPTLSPADHRASLQARWSPILPQATWLLERKERAGSALVYLDASGSMSPELPLILAVLSQLSQHIQQPFWAFSTVVSPATIRGGRLQTTSTGGTSLACVLRHVAEQRPAAAVVITDGYIEPIEPALCANTSATQLHVIVTRHGTTRPIEAAGLRYTQLAEVPQ